MTWNSPGTGWLDVVPVAVIVSLASLGVSSFISLRGQRRQYFGDLRKWADESCSLLSKTVHTCDLDPAQMPPGEFFQLRHELRIELSAQIDRGRWFFPNLKHLSIGADKEVAFRGIRTPVLDCLVAAYRICGGFDYQQQAPNVLKRDALVQIKRTFVSEITIYLNPRDPRTQFRALMTYSGRSNSTRSGSARSGSGGSGGA